MLSKFSVKHPYLIVVAVIICLILGGVSVTKMRTDLLPEMDLPYLAVITTDAGSSAAKVEEEVTEPLESVLSKVSGVSSVTSSSSDNFSMIFLQFEDGTNMDAALVKVSSAANEVASELPDSAGAPSYMEISMDMMATLYVVASSSDKDIYKLSEFVNDTVVPQLERINGVADVSTTGTVEKTVEVRLDQKKIDKINDQLLGEVNSQLSEARDGIAKGESQLKSAKKNIAKQKKQLKNQQSKTEDKLATAVSGLTMAISGALTQASTFGAQAQSLQAQAAAAAEAGMMEKAAELGKQAQEAAAKAQAAQGQASEYQKQLEKAQAGSMSAASQFGSANAQMAAAETSIKSSKKELDQARKQYEDARDQALENANIDKLVEKSTLAKMIVAQNFSMPAGYLGNGGDDDDQWLLRVGEEFGSLDDLKNLLLVDLDGVGEIRLKDVAQVVVVDNVGDAYMKINGVDGVLLTVFKSSTASTSEVSDAVAAELKELEEDFPDLSLAITMDQGEFIDLYISTILRSLLLGALLAVVVLLLFLRDWKPTLVVAFSIPFSVLFAIVLLYFSNITLNIMTLGGISLAIGMLVDNSVIVLENIYRLRARGIPAARAAVQGAKQITGAVVASTLTTICVFLPIVFTTGVVNQLLMPFALSIAYVLVASLLIAVTLVPTVASVLFRNHTPRQIKWFAHVQDAYGNALGFFLNHKALPLVVSVVLLVAAVYGVLNMGISMIPSMTSETVSVTVKMPEDATKQEAFKTADEITEAIMGVEGVGQVSVYDGTTSISTVSAATANAKDIYSVFEYNIKLADSIKTEAAAQQVTDDIEKATEGMAEEIMVGMSSSDSMSSMMGSGLSLTVQGPDIDTLVSMSEDIMKIVEEVPGYTNVENGMEDAAHEVNLLVNVDKLTKKGYTVAQLYADLAADLAENVSSTDLVLDGSTVQVVVTDKEKTLTRDNLLDTVIDMTSQSSGETKSVRLGTLATIENGYAADSIRHQDSVRTMTITAEVEDGYNNALLSRTLTEKLNSYTPPEGYTYSLGGELDNIKTMLEQMMLLLLLGFILIYLIMVAQFQSLLSPFIIILTVPLAFTGGFFALLFAGEQLTLLSLMGFAVLMGTVVNNGIVFVDYVNQLRRGGLEKRSALVATGRTRMRPILMTALTTILAMLPLAFSQDIGASMERGMALVVIGGLLYATFMTLFVVPIMYDILYRRVPVEVDLGPDDLDEDPGDAQAFLEAMKGAHAAPPAEPRSSGSAGSAPASV